MRIHGLTKLTVVDYPSKVACIVFTGSCNFRCPYCQNGGLVLSPWLYPEIGEEEVFSFLARRRGILDGVVISGGEPTINRDLPEFIRKIKDLGYLVKLDTNGTNPDMLRHLVEDGLLDYVAMDIKNSLEMYGNTIGIDNFDTGPIEESIKYLLSGVVDYEFRTTVTQQHHSDESFKQIASMCAGARRYYLQNYVASENTIEKYCSPCSRKQLDSYIGILKNHIRNVQLRDNTD